MTEQEPTLDILVTDVLLRLTVLEKMLIDKGIIDHAEYVKNLEAVATSIANTVLEKVK